MDGTLLRESWDVHFIGDSKVGQRITRVYRIGEQPRDRIYRRSEDFLQIRRFGELSEQSITMISLETPDGKILRQAYEEKSGERARRVEGTIHGDQLQLRSLSDAPGDSKSLSWSTDNGGLFAIAKTFAQTPMQPGERRRVLLFLPVVDRTGQLELVADDWEETRLHQGSRKLLRVNVYAKGEPNGESYWTDEQGDILKAVHNGTIDVTYRADERLALLPNETNGLDVALEVLVPLARPFPRAREALSATYRLRLQRDDPSEHFVHNRLQQLDAESDRVAQLTVTASWAVPSGSQESFSPRQPTSAEQQANRWIQSDDPRVRALATAAAGSLEEPHAIALALERYVHRTVNTVDYRHVMASASEVVRQRSGDCSEQAVLLAAACRASGIPARVVVGLIYSSDDRGFVYHMWNEAWATGRWHPLDATIGQGVVGADHIKLTHGSLSADTTHDLLSAVSRVAGQLQIDLLQVELKSD